MLTYLLFDSESPLEYAQRVKLEIKMHFDELNIHYYYSTKSLRKTLRLINKYSRFTKFKPGEIELLLHFSHLFVTIIPKETKHLPLLGLHHRSLAKAASLIKKIHEDLHYDYAAEYNHTLKETINKFRHWGNEKFNLKEI